MMAAGAPGEAKYKPLRVMSKEEIQQRAALERVRLAEREASREPFKADLSKKPARKGVSPRVPELSAVTVRERQARDGRANAGDVHGHNERQRETLPNSFDRQQRAHKKKRNALSMHNVQIKRGLYARVRVSVSA
jgi:hypothetical protein